MINASDQVTRFTRINQFTKTKTTSINPIYTNKFHVIIVDKEQRCDRTTLLFYSILLLTNKRIFVVFAYYENILVRKRVHYRPKVSIGLNRRLYEKGKIRK